MEELLLLVSVIVSEQHQLEIVIVQNELINALNLVMLLIGMS